jgi:hypothetical protein
MQQHAARGLRKGAKLRALGDDEQERREGANGSARCGLGEASSRVVAGHTWTPSTPPRPVVARAQLSGLVVVGG